MIANAALLAAVTLFLWVAWLAGELVFLAPYKRALFREHWSFLGGFALLAFVNLFALYYTLGRWLFLRDSGHKLRHLDRQLGTSDTALADLDSSPDDRG